MVYAYIVSVTRMQSAPSWKYFFLLLGAIVFVAVFSGGIFLWQSGVPVRYVLFGAPTPTPTAAYLNTIERGGPVAKSITRSTIEYWLYGHIVSIDTEDSQGLHGQFIFEADPLKNSIPIIILNHEQVYKLLVYSQGFGQQSMLNQSDAATLRKTILETTSTVELRVPFSKTQVSKAQVALMNTFDVVNQGDWTRLSKTTLLVDSVGIEKP